MKSVLLSLTALAISFTLGDKVLADESYELALAPMATTQLKSDSLTRGPDAVDSSSVTSIKMDDSIESQVKVSPVAGISAFSMPTDAFNYSGVTATSKGEVQPGLTVGAEVDLGSMEKKNRVLSTGLLIYQAGADLDVNTNSGKKSASVDAYYMTIPLLAKTRLVNGKEIFFKGGFNNAILLSESVEGVSKRNVGSRGLDILGSLGVAGKIGIGQFTGDSKVSVEASYNRSLFDARETLTNTQSQGFFITLGIPL